MNRPAQGSLASLRHAFLMLTALTLTACQDREAEIAERNREFAKASRLAQSELTQRDAAAEAARAEEMARRANLAQFYGHQEEGEEEDDEQEPAEKDASEPDFLDPTSDYFDNTIAEPEAVSASDSGDAGAMDAQPEA